MLVWRPSANITGAAGNESGAERGLGRGGEGPGRPPGGVREEGSPTELQPVESGCVCVGGGDGRGHGVGENGEREVLETARQKYPRCIKNS